MGGAFGLEEYVRWRFGFANCMRNVVPRDSGFRVIRAEIGGLCVVMRRKDSVRNR